VKDSFVSHKNSISNLLQIRKSGLTSFLDLQMRRIKVLTVLIQEFDDGKSKSKYCTAAALLPISSLEQIIQVINKKIQKNNASQPEIKIKARLIKAEIDMVSNRENIALTLRK